MAHLVEEYRIELQVYHNEIVGRIKFRNAQGGIEDSAMYSLAEINNIINLWKADALLGSFGIGSLLARDAVAILENAK